MDFNEVMVAVFIATIGLLSVAAQMILGILMKQLGSKHTIMVGLLFEMLQLMWFGFGSQMWLVLIIAYIVDNVLYVLLTYCDKHFLLLTLTFFTFLFQDDVGCWCSSLSVKHHLPCH